MAALCGAACGHCGGCTAEWEADGPFPADDDNDELLMELFGPDGALSDEEIEALASARLAGF